MADADPLVTDPRPLLAFPPPVAGPIPTGVSRAIRRPQHPAGARQADRLGVQFEALQDALEAGRATASHATTEPDPELVVVFDVADSVAMFLKTAALVPGLEFLAELDDGTVEPDEDFFFVKKDGQQDTKVVPETLYLVMTNAEAAGELVSLFTRWTAEPKMKFPYRLAPLRHAFEQLRDLRRWSAVDRVQETGLIEQWREDLVTVGGQGLKRVEIELWFRSDAERRRIREQEVESLIRDAGGIVLKKSVVAGIGYHAILADIPHNQVEAVLERGPQAIELLLAEPVMFVSPFRPMSIPILGVNENESRSAATLGETPAPGLEPQVALFDGVPISNHEALKGRLVVDDPEALAAAYSSVEFQQHGTAMASLILHGDLEVPGAPLSRPLYVRPIMRPHVVSDREAVPDDELFVDLIHGAFHRMMEGDGNHAATAPSVRVVNLSIGDPGRVFARRMSPAGRLIDWLAYRYNLLIIVSAGNHPSEPILDTALLTDLTALRKAVLLSGYEQVRHRRLLSPADSINALSIGAVHTDQCTGDLSDAVIDLCDDGMPAPYGAVGFGHLRSVKPEILMPGGRQVHQRPEPNATGPVTLTLARKSRIGPGLRVAAPDPFGGPNGYAYTAGTSNATALATRASSQLLDLLVDHVDAADEFAWPDAQYHPVLVKGLLVHAAHWGHLRQRLAVDLGLDRRGITQLIGYGPVDNERLGAAASNRAVLIGAGSISADQRHQLAFPIPAALARTTDWRRLTLTLAWISPTNPRTLKHRMARLSFDGHTKDRGLGREEGEANTVKKGTVQHEVFEGARAWPFLQGDTLAVDVDCKVDGDLERPVRYALVASLEVRTTVQADIHAQVRQTLREQVQQRLTARARQ